MAKQKGDYYAVATRTMLSEVKEIGAMPFILFEYYLTWTTAPEGIKPPLQQIADDLGLEKNAVCNLRTKLVKAGWIKYENGQVFITKSFTKNESPSENYSQKMNEDSQKMNNRSQKMNPLYKEENSKDSKKEGEENAPTQAESKTENLDKHQLRSLSASEVLKQPSFAPTVETEAETIYRDVFGGVFLRGDQTKLFENIPNFRADVWRRTCELWRNDNYRATSLGSLIDRYSKEVAKVPKIENGIIQHDTKPKAKFLH